MPGRRKKPRGVEANRTRRSTPKRATTRAAADQAAELRCWLCAQPLEPGEVSRPFGRDSVEVHRRCYEQAMEM